MKVSLSDHAQQYQAERADILAAIEAVCGAQQFILGPQVGALEQELSAYLGTRFGVGVGCGTDALLLSLMAAGVGPGDEVITVPFTFYATAAVIARLGARPVFVDIYAESFNIDVGQVEARLSPHTKAIIAVHLYGGCAAVEQIRALADGRGIWVIEDACQAIGARRRDVRAGALGHAGCFSFYPSKALGGFGDGGLVATNDARMHHRLTALRTHGGHAEYRHDWIGINSRLDELQAAILRVKLRHLEQRLARRRTNAALYGKLVQTAGIAERVVLPREEAGDLHAYSLFTIRAQGRDQLRHYLDERGVQSKVCYPLPLHLQPCFRYLDHSRGDFPQSERAAEEALSLPIHAALGESQIGYVVECLQHFYRSQ